MGIIDARNGPAPTAAQLTAWFPDWTNADTWNLAAISPLVRTYTIGVGDFNVLLDSYKAAGVGAGRLEDRRQPDAEPRAAVGRLDPWLRQRCRGAALAAGRAARRLRQLPAAARLCLPADGTHRPPRRLGPVLRGRARRRFLVRDRQRADCRTSSTPTTGGPTSRSTRPTAQALPTYEQALQPFCDSPTQAAALRRGRRRTTPGAAPCLTRALQEFRGPFEFATSRGRGRPRSASSGSSAPPSRSKRTTCSARDATRRTLSTTST